MSLPAGTTVINGFALSPDGALYVTPTGNGAITGGTITGTNVPYTLAETGIPVGVASSGTMGNNGAVSALTALQKTYSGGIWLWYPASAIVTGSTAGYYWTVMSSTTAGTVYNSTYSGTGVPTIGVTTAFVTTGPGAFTGDTGTRGIAITLPAGAMGSNGYWEGDADFAFTNNADNKTSGFYFDGSGGTAIAASNFNSAAAGSAYAKVRNAGIATVQNGSGYTLMGSSITSAGNSAPGASTGSATTIFIRTSHAAAATDNSVIEGFSIRVSYAQ